MAKIKSFELVTKHRNKGPLDNGYVSQLAGRPPHRTSAVSQKSHYHHHLELAGLKASPILLPLLPTFNA